MSRLSMLRVAAVVAATTLPVLALPAAAFAQAGSPAAPSTKPAPQASASARVEQHIKQLHDELGITAAEQPQWDQFAQIMRDNAAEMGKTFADRAAKADTMSAADNMQSYAQLAQLHAENTQKLAAAFRPLYDSFPPQQKQVADTVFRNHNEKRQHKR